MTPATAFYLHGLPGSFESEMEIVFGKAPYPPLLRGLDRLGSLNPEDNYDQTILRAFDAAADACLHNGPVRLIAFSLGAMSALQIAAARPDCISSLDLIAPAAPLQLGDFLAGMAGKPVFEAAQRGHFRLGILTHLQSAGLRLAPGLIAGQLFASAPDAERGLMAEPSRRKALLAGMTHALHRYPKAYQAELRAYVSDWTDALPKVRAPIRIWQGAADTWAPPAMARTLSAAVGGPSEIALLDGLSHYGALVHSLPEILA